MKREEIKQRSGPAASQHIGRSPLTVTHDSGDFKETKIKAVWNLSPNKSMPSGLRIKRSPVPDRKQACLLFLHYFLKRGAPPPLMLHPGARPACRRGRSVTDVELLGPAGPRMAFNGKTCRLETGLNKDEEAVFKETSSSHRPTSPNI